MKPARSCAGFQLFVVGVHSKSLTATVELQFGEVYDRLKAQCEAELDQVRVEIAANQSADRKYLEYGVRLLELAQTVYQSYSRRSPEQKRPLLKFVVSKCSLEDSKLTPMYQQPFGLLASTASMSHNRAAPDRIDQGLLESKGG